MDWVEGDHVLGFFEGDVEEVEEDLAADDARDVVIIHNVHRYQNKTSIVGILDIKSHN